MFKPPLQAEDRNLFLADEASVPSLIFEEAISRAKFKHEFHKHWRYLTKEQRQLVVRKVRVETNVVKQQIRAKQFTQDIIDAIGRRVYELVLPFPKDHEQEKAIIQKVQEVFTKRTEAKTLCEMYYSM